jgi:hypothetical protein
MLRPQDLNVKRKLRLGVAIRVFCYVAVTLVSPNAVWAQDQKAELVDEFGRMPCDELYARASYFVQKVVNEPTSRGLVVIYPKKGTFQSADYRRKTILGQFENGELADRVEFVQGAERDEIKIELWKIPAGANEPEYLGTKWVDPAPDLSKPFIFGYEDEIGECPTFIPRKFAKVINDNSGSRAHIVVRGGDRYAMNPRDFASQWIDTFTKQFKIPRKRIKVFYAKRDGTLTYAEFWFIPAKKR